MADKKKMGAIKGGLAKMLNPGPEEKEEQKDNAQAVAQEVFEEVDDPVRGRVGRPRKLNPESYTRTTLIIDKVLLMKLQRISSDTRTPIKDWVEWGVAEVVKRYEAVHGEVPTEERERKTVEQLLSGDG